MNMKGKILVSVLLTALLASLMVVTSCGPTNGEDVYKLTIQSGYPAGDVSMELLHDFAAAASEKSGGLLEISVYAEPEIVPLEGLFAAVKLGTLDMLQCGGTFWGGIVPVGEIEFGIPFAYDIPEEETFEGKAEEIRRWFFEDGFVDILRAEYGNQGLYWLDMHTYGPVTLHSAVNATTTAEFAGLKVRDEGLWRTFHENLGMVGSDIPPGDVYSALQLGTIDMTQWDVSAITGLNWHEPAPYWIHPHQSEHIIGHILINMDSWNALPADIQQALAAAAEDYWDATVETYKAEVEAAYGYPGVVELWMTTETEDEWRNEALLLWDEVAEADAASAAAIALLKAWRGVE